MSRYPRYALISDDCYFHVTWQCHNGEWLLKEEWAKEFYYYLLLRFKDAYEIIFFAYHLMENHPHLIGWCRDKKKFSDFFRVVNNLFARGYNKRMGRKGQVVMDRFKSPRIETDLHMLRAMTYVDLNGVRCGRDRRPGETKWSSYDYYAFGKEDPLLTPSPSYLTLGAIPEERQAAYRAIVDELIRQDAINISNVCFIGNPDWVLARHEELKEKMRARRKKLKQSPLKKPADVVFSGERGLFQG